MTKRSSIAKITRPSLPRALPRKRLFRLLDTGRSSPVTWVSGPGGSGKTTLVASYLDARRLPCLWYHLDDGDSDIATFFYYLGLAARKAVQRREGPLPLLTPEFLNDVPLFTRRYFENLYARLKPPFVIVLDNYHHIARQSLFHEMIREACLVIPEGISVIIVSRGLPPPGLALFQTYGRIYGIGWDELKFDVDETRALLESGRKKDLSGTTLDQLLRTTTGWAAGLVFLMQRLRTGGIGAVALEQLKTGELFDYFATEFFEKTDKDVQAFLLKTSFLPVLSPASAADLTGRSDAGTLLAGLSRNHFFTERRSVADPVYQYHPLFREFLAARARATYPAHEIRKLMRRGGALLEATGQAEDAAELYRSAEEWASLAALIIARAESMASQGRNQQLENWLKSLPSQLLEKKPMLLYWMGLCRMPFQLFEARRYFEQALALFRKKRDRAGVFLSWSGAVEALVQEMGNIRRLKAWVRLFEELVKECGSPPAEIEAQVTIRMFAALQWRRNSPIFVFWNKKALALMDGNADAGLRMVTGFYLFSYHLWWIGDYPTSSGVLEIMRRIVKTGQDIPPQSLALLNHSEALYAFVTGAHEHCLKMVSQGTEMADKHGIHIWDKALLMAGSGSCLCVGDITRAGQILDQMAVGLEEGRLFDRFYYYHKSAWRFFLMADVAQAIAHEKAALRLASEAGFEIAEAQAYFAMAHLMRASGERKRAQEHIQRCRGIGRRMGSMIVEFMSLLSEAAFAFDKKDEAAGLAHLKEAMALGRAQEFVYFCWWHPALITPLCIKALEAGIEPEYVKGLIRTCNLVPETPPSHLEDWPWPLRIYTLGRFELVKDGKTMRFPGKEQKKPLELLKVLIAFGGKNVAEGLITDALWPDAEGDLAHRAFDTTLHRLRRLIGNDVLQLQNCQLSLDADRCWIDVLAFERLFSEETKNRARSRITSAVRNRRSSAPPGLIEKAAALYRGHFLPMDSRQTWVLGTRERLRNKFLRLVMAQGEAWEQTRMFSEAGDCYRQGLEIEGLAEELYQRLMICHSRLGQQAEAVKVYHRCKTMLTKSLGLVPSARTEDIYSSLRLRKSIL